VRERIVLRGSVFVSFTSRERGALTSDRSRSRNGALARECASDPAIVCVCESMHCLQNQTIPCVSVSPALVRHSSYSINTPTHKFAHVCTYVQVMSLVTYWKVGTRARAGTIVLLSVNRYISIHTACPTHVHTCAHTSALLTVENPNRMTTSMS